MSPRRTKSRRWTTKREEKRRKGEKETGKKKRGRRKKARSKREDLKQSRCIEGQHKSCLFVRFLFLLASQLLRNLGTHPKALRVLERLNGQFCSLDAGEGKERETDFFSVRAVRKCVTHLCSPGKKEKKPCVVPPLRELRLKKNPHYAGFFVSLMWLHALFQVGCRCRETIWLKFRNLNLYWSKNFELSHWIPTFLTLTIFLEVESLSSQEECTKKSLIFI